MDKKKVLVTGGAGFIGSHLADLLLEAGHDVSIIDDLSGGYRRNVNPKAIFYKCDLRNKKKAKNIIAKIKPEIVYHLAANAAENKAQFSPIDITSRNYDTFINTLVPALNAGMRRIVVTSSIAVYGSIKPPFKEEDRPEPEDLYGLSKLSMEESLKILSKVHDFEYVIVRPHNVYGPRQNMEDPYRNVVTIFMNAILSGKPYYIYGDGEQRRCFSYIDDVANSIFRCGFADVSSMIFNVGSSKDYTINRLSDSIRKVTKTQLKPAYLNYRPQEVKIAVSDHTLAKKYLNYKDTVTLQEGIKRTWEYAKQLGPQKQKLGSVEIFSSKMPENWKTEKDKWPMVSVIISNHNGMKLGILKESLSEILKNRYKKLEIILVDNNSDDNSVAFVKENIAKHTRLRVIENKVNNYSKGLNLGLKASQGDYVLIMHNDVILEDNAIDEIVKYLENNLDVAMLQGKILLYHDHNIIDSAGESMDRIGVPITIGAGKFDGPGFNKKREVLSAAGSCFVVRKSCFDVVGRFDESYKIGYEAMDLSLRLWNAGYKIIYLPTVGMFHKHGSTNLNPLYKDKIFWHFYKNRLITIAKNFPLMFVLKYMPLAFALSLFAAFIDIAIKGNIKLGLLRIVSIIWLIGNLPYIVFKRTSRKIKIRGQAINQIYKLLYKGNYIKRLNFYLSQ